MTEAKKPDNASEQLVEAAFMPFAQITFGDGEEAVVVVFDIRSSSTLVEDLTTKGRLHDYIWLIGETKRRLAEIQMRLKPPRFTFYKFTGDGWILLFPVRGLEGAQLPAGAPLEVMRELSTWFQPLFHEWAERHLDHEPPTNIGLTFGVDRGPLHHTTIFGASEYLARSIIVASRLQGAAGEDVEGEVYEALVTRSAFNTCFGHSPAEDVELKMKNIGQGREFKCKKISLLQPKSAGSRPNQHPQGIGSGARGSADDLGDRLRRAQERMTGPEIGPLEKELIRYLASAREQDCTIGQMARLVQSIDAFKQTSTLGVEMALKRLAGVEYVGQALSMSGPGYWFLQDKGKLYAVENGLDR